ncbi:MAG: hypothetical protein OQK24_01375 [Magnetovibrio sp.]|nr:hypothetical protein [Magnetovibrio sp.]
MLEQSKRMKLFVFIESDICIRHFVLTGALKELTQNHDVTFIFPPEDWNRITLDPTNLPLNAPFRRLTLSRQRIWLWKRLFQAQQLMLRPGRDYGERRRYVRHLLGWKASVQLTVYGLPGIFQIFKRNIFSRLKKNPCTELTTLLKEERPDLVIHPSTFDGYFINDVIAESAQQDIPSVLIMNSWDNPSIKQTVAGIPDKCVVWGEQTAAHCKRYMNIPDENLIKAGAAQFDIFRQPPSLDREAFCAEHSIDPNHKILMYAGSSKKVDEYSHLSVLNEACEQGILKNTSILYRPHPWGECGKDGERMQSANWKHVEIERSMAPYVERVAKGDCRIFLDAPYSRTHDVLTHIDAVISPLSTIILEAALHGKPPLCFMPLDQEQQGSIFEIFSGMVHFEEIFRSDTFPVATSQKELIEKSVELLASTEDLDYLKVLERDISYFVSPPSKPYSEVIDSVLRKIYDKAHKSSKTREG